MQPSKRMLVRVEVVVRESFTKEVFLRWNSKSGWKDTSSSPGTQAPFCAGPSKKGQGGFFTGLCPGISQSQEMGREPLLNSQGALLNSWRILTPMQQ